MVLANGKDSHRFSVDAALFRRPMVGVVDFLRADPKSRQGDVVASKLYLEQLTNWFFNMFQDVAYFRIERARRFVHANVDRVGRGLVGGVRRKQHVKL